LAGSAPWAGATHGMRETMRAVLRFTIAMFAAGLCFGPSLTLAQNAAQPATNTPTNTPATDTIGPRDLQNFSLNGTVTRSADTPPSAPSTRAQTRQSPAATVAPHETPQATQSRPQASASPSPRAAPPPAANPGQSLTADLPPTATTTATLPTTAPEPGFSPGSGSATATLAAVGKPSLWPWLSLAGVLGAGAAFLLWRRRSREAVAGGAEFDLRRQPDPQPQARPVPRPPPAAPPPPAPKPSALPAGIVSTRLRPWVEIAFAPLGCVVDDEKISVEFDVQIVNSGSVPARDVLVEASMFNASATQEHDLGTFFSNPVGQGERIDRLPPLQSVTIRTTLVAPRANIQLFELAGRQVFVPLVAFNALYRWGGGRGQTSAGYLLGRETKSDKLGPLRADLGPRTFTGLGIKLLPTGLRK
jgi:hypothetical protein